MPEKTEELRARLDQWLKEQGAYIPGPDPDYDPTKSAGSLKGKKGKGKK
jgi:hypothetical protein